ncbi:hypothetical protein [Sphingobium sp. KCTC 72723]|uniref:hypothetical protein n=1 Tax=Sphingobium sp. KCTC 72723 TaxID=2733867 RepID=UPI00165E1874|nr:hypothetical protein [Sphingobium sp. KCTC 72723]
MSDETPSGTQTDTSGDELAAIKAQLADTAKTVLAGVPDHLRGLIPVSLSPADQIAWFNQAKATGAFDKPVVLPTDGGAKPAITPRATDTTSMPVYARLAAGYSK